LSQASDLIRNVAVSLVFCCSCRRGRLNYAPATKVSGFFGVFGFRRKSCAAH